MGKVVRRNTRTELQGQVWCDRTTHCMNFYCLLYPRGTVSSRVPSKAVCHKIGPALWKIGSTDFVKISKKGAFSSYLSQFSA